MKEVNCRVKTLVIRYEHGRTVCMCLRSDKKCRRWCEADVVVRDPFRGWEKLMKQDRFGKVKDDERKIVLIITGLQGPG